MSQVTLILLLLIFGPAGIAAQTQHTNSFVNGAEEKHPSPGRGAETTIEQKANLNI